MAIPKVAAIHDLSGLGKCSLTAAIPILSVCGVQAVPLATAVLSNQTAFESYTGVDLSEYLPMIAAEWKKRKLSLDGIFTGYLSNEQQVEWVGGFIDSFAKDDTLILVDPVLGDEGVYYRGFGEQMRLAMRRLCGKADVITPNLTEAALLLDLSYDALPTGERGCLEIAERLSLEGRRSVVLTGASAAPECTGAACFDARTGRAQMIQTRRVPREFHGTGDVFASVLTGALVQGESLPAATRLAVEFVRVCGERTAAEGMPMREGVDFEPLLGLLVPGTDRL